MVSSLGMCQLPLFNCSIMHAGESDISILTGRGAVILKFHPGLLEFSSCQAMDPSSSNDECVLVQLNGSDMAPKATKVTPPYLTTHYWDTNFILFIN